MKRVLTAVTLAGILCSLFSCATGITAVGGQTELVDDAWAGDTYALGRTVSMPDAPFAALGAAWVDPATEFPGYLTQIVDPFNWTHMLWRGFHTLWSIPVNPIYHLTDGSASDSWNAYVQPVGETVAYDMTPAPHGGDWAAYWASRSDSHVRNISNAGETLKYNFFNTNSKFPPYDRWFPEQIQRDKTTIHRTLDLHFFDYDWGDPYLD